MILPLLWTVVSYLLGSVPSSYLAGRWVRGIDLREHGSGNLGTTNTFRVLGPRVAAPVMVFDMAKGFIPAGVFAQWDGSEQWAWALAYGAAAILGHMFSIYMGFRGGKGVATGAGVFLALSPVAVGIAIVAWLAVLGGTRTVSMASIAAAIVMAGAVVLTESRIEVVGLGIAVAAFVIYAHRSNIKRIIRGEEHSFRAKAPEGTPDQGAEK